MKGHSRFAGNTPEPYVYLLAAVLHQAMVDAAAPCRTAAAARRRRDAIAWLNDCAVDVAALLGHTIDDWRELL